VLDNGVRVRAAGARQKATSAIIRSPITTNGNRETIQNGEAQRGLSTDQMALAG
jgi:hypothetical protein